MPATLTPPPLLTLDAWIRATVRAIAALRRRPDMREAFVPGLGMVRFDEIRTAAKWAGRFYVEGDRDRAIAAAAEALYPDESTRGYALDDAETLIAYLEQFLARDGHPTVAGL